MKWHTEIYQSSNVYEMFTPNSVVVNIEWKLICENRPMEKLLFNISISHSSFECGVCMSWNLLHITGFFHFQISVTFKLPKNHALTNRSLRLLPQCPMLIDLLHKCKYNKYQNHAKHFQK